MAMIRKTFVPSDGLDEHAFTHEYIKAEMIGHEQPAYNEQISSIYMREVGGRRDHKIRAGDHLEHPAMPLSDFKIDEKIFNLMTVL